MKQERNNLITAAVLTALGIAYLVSARSIKVFEGFGATPISARTIPQIWGTALVILSVLLLLRSMIRYGKLKKEEDPAERTGIRGWFAENYTVVGTFIVLFLYAVLLRNVGYLITTTVYLIIQMLLLTGRERINKKTIILVVIIAVIFSLVTDFIFVKLLHVLLPRGIFGL